MSILLDGKTIAKRLQEELKKQILPLKRPPHLVVFLSHPNTASEIYVRSKHTACLNVGIKVSIDTTPHNTTETLIHSIQRCNDDPSIDAILVQLPLHPNVLAEKVLESISPAKDVDGLHPMNLGKLASSDRSGFIPCTPLGILRLMKEYNIDISGKLVTIIGRSRIVGTPLSLLLSRPWEGANATVTLAHSKTKQLKELTLASDVIISCVGKSHTVTSDMIKEGSIVIDVGINRLTDSESGKNRLVGDVDFEEVKKKASYITPVPGGIGPMTIVSLLENTVRATLIHLI
jgi:methylenetetrahydrofolate dehydrogenase (NADP+)/methenyltetrahydrofolate cyclohydrolase